MSVIFFAINKTIIFIAKKRAARSDLCRVPHVRVWSDNYRFPLNLHWYLQFIHWKMKFWCCPGMGHLHPILRPHRGFFCMNARPHCGAFAAFPKKKKKWQMSGRWARLELTEAYIAPAWFWSFHARCVRAVHKLLGNFWATFQIWSNF